MSVARLVEAALAEDLPGADLTSELIVPADLELRALIVSRAHGVLAGQEAADEVTRRLGVRILWAARDGSELEPGQVVGFLDGAARAVLAAERTTLNFLCRLSGIATLTAAFARACAPVPVLDTRKTTPGWRALEKAAVRAGGGRNHRMSLSDAILVKDNHLALGGAGLAEALARARRKHPEVWIEVEADDLGGVERAVAAGADWVLLDNMTLEATREAVALAAGRTLLEASGGMTLAHAAEVARTGVDAISVGALTHSAPALDLGLDLTDEVVRRGP